MNLVENRHQIDRNMSVMADEYLNKWYALSFNRLIVNVLLLSSLAGYNVIYKNYFSRRSSVLSGPLTLKQRLSICESSD